jgi:hypothetical protein
MKAAADAIFIRYVFAPPYSYPKHVIIRMSLTGDWKRPMKFRRAIVLALLCLVPQLAATSVRAQDDHFACMNDAMTVCGQYIPDRDRVAHCLMANRSRVSPACRTALKRFK